MTLRTRIKICGVTRIDDALEIARLGGDSIGLVFHQQSPRCIDLQVAAQIKKKLPPFTTLTALLMDEQESWISQVVEQVQPDCLQFHGQEANDSCEYWQLPYLKAIPMGSVMDVSAYVTRFPTAQGFLLDSHAVGQQGGSGSTFDWSSIPALSSAALLLAGGIHPGNVGTAITQVRPWAIDVSSGVEVAKGVKDTGLLRALFYAVRETDAEIYG